MNCPRCGEEIRESTIKPGTWYHTMMTPDWCDREVMLDQAEAEVSEGDTGWKRIKKMKLEGKFGRKGDIWKHVK